MQKAQYNLKGLTTRRQSLRKNSTSAEAALWGFLKNRQLDGKRFRRQFSVDYYILDFYCPEELLCIELDGHQHFLEEGRIKDVKRDAYLKEKYNITTLRFENSGVWHNLEGILAEIRNHIHKKAPKP